jgi:hypothetical protein
MGVDTGKQLHVVILRCNDDDGYKQHLIHLGVYHDFHDLDPLMKRYQIEKCVIDGLPETHAARTFADGGGCQDPGRVRGDRGEEVPLHPLRRRPLLAWRNGAPCGIEIGFSGWMPDRCRITRSL